MQAVAVSLLDFLYGTNEVLAEKAYNLVKCWRVGIKSCKTEWDLIVLSMYLEVLSTDLTNYNITSGEVMGMINHILNIFNITNVVVNQSDVITYVTNTVVINNYVTEISVNVPRFSGTYSGVGAFTVTIAHNLDKYNCTVTVTDTSGATRTRVYPDINEIDENTIELVFTSTSSGEYEVM